MDDNQIMREIRELERQIDRRFTDLAEKIHQMSERISVDVATLKTKAAFVGFFAGAVPGFVMFLFDFLKRN